MLLEFLLVLLERKENFFSKGFFNQTVQVGEEISCDLIDVRLKFNTLALSTAAVEVIIILANLFFLIDLVDFKLYIVRIIITELNCIGIVLRFRQHANILYFVIIFARL